MLNSLRSLCAATVESERKKSNKENFTRPVCLPITPEWFAFLHPSLSCPCTSDVTPRNEAHVSSSASSCTPSADRQDIVNLGDELSWSATLVSLYEGCLQLAHSHRPPAPAHTCVVIDAVVQAAWAPVLSNSSGAERQSKAEMRVNFPGPMCSPFRRSNVAMLRSHEYTFTEKSDGLRVILVVRQTARFPCWLPQSAPRQRHRGDDVTENGEAEGNVLLFPLCWTHISTLMTLEAAALALRGGSATSEPARHSGITTSPALSSEPQSVTPTETTEMQDEPSPKNMPAQPCEDTHAVKATHHVWLNGRIGVALVLESQPYVLQQDPDHGTDCFLLHMISSSVLSSADGVVTASHRTPLRLRRSHVPRHLTYCFDRSMDAVYVLLCDDAGVALSMDMVEQADVDVDAQGHTGAPCTTHLPLPVCCSPERVHQASTSKNQADHGRTEVEPPSLFAPCRVAATSRVDLTAYDQLVLDAELLEVHDNRLPDDTTRRAPSRSLALALFDMYSYRPRSTHTAAAPTVFLTRHTMSARHHRLRELMCNRVQPSPVVPTSTLASSVVRWFVKDMWHLGEMAACLSHLSRTTREGRADEYWYAGALGYTRNDGFIFTPDTFPLMSGASKVQVKWKWRALLSVDWLVYGEERCRGWRHVVAAYFRKNNFHHRDDVAGHWRLMRPMPLLNPRNFRLPAGRRRRRWWWSARFTRRRRRGRWSGCAGTRRRPTRLPPSSPSMKVWSSV